MKTVIALLLIVFPFVSQNRPAQVHLPLNQRPTVSFTFDDGKTTALGGYELKVWNGLILAALKENNIKAILFVAGHNKKTLNGRYVLESWNNAGHRLANHSLNHPNFNNDDVTLEQFKNELLANDALIKGYSNYFRYFRFPYLKEGNTPEKVAGFREFMKQNNYRHGHVTIDASDWYVDSRLRNYLAANPGADVGAYKTFYIQHIYDRAVFYDSLAYSLTGKHINHSLLLHHNLVSALFLKDLIRHFKAKGWNVMDADKAYTDEVYKTVTQTTPAGESLIWSMAKQSGKFEQVLRYPAEGGEYEKARMDSLGL
ncbi:MAG: polysaccharide deacetylase family protein [Bacteroidota bacterium]